MGKKGIYIYGIINSNSASDLFTPKDSYQKESVYTIPYQDVSAAVSNSEIIDFTYSSKDASAQLLVWHQKVIEKIMDLKYTIIPVRLGTFTVDEAEVKDILSKGYSLIKNIMEKVRDKIETDLVATWTDFNSILKEIGEEEEIKKLKEKILDNPRITLDDQMEVGVMIKKALDEKREKYALQIQTFLKRYCTAFKVHELMDDRMVINAACLINIGEQKDFDRKIEEINTKFAEKLNFRCVGPLPPYSFYTLEIKKMQFEEIDWAKKKLRLSDDFATKNEVKKVYRKLAFSFHPDRNPNTPGIEKEFDELNKAYRILTEYCGACKQTDKEDSLSFSEEEFEKNKILVKVKD
ncbi:GvpL/GvpF family gas vesicle protein [bacterium]|nr:GvpL/GvpF family gas vesicle protein [bacterium]